MKSLGRPCIEWGFVKILFLVVSVSPSLLRKHTHTNALLLASCEPTLIDTRQAHTHTHMLENVCTGAYQACVLHRKSTEPPHGSSSFIVVLRHHPSAHQKVTHSRADHPPLPHTGSSWLGMAFRNPGSASVRGQGRQCPGSIGVGGREQQHLSAPGMGCRWILDPPLRCARD